MANVKQGLLHAPGNWWKHQRRSKRLFWKAERQAGQKLAKAGAQGKV